MTDRPQPDRRALVAGLLIAAAVLAVFGQTVDHGFLNYDDDEYVTENRLVRGGSSPAAIVTAFETVHAFTWHPITTISHMLDVQLFGLDPSGHHLTSVLLHAATAAFLFLALRRMTGAFWPSAFAALLFAIHPLRVESVAWISERKDVLSGLFFMLTLVTYARYARRLSAGAPFPTGRYLATLGCFALGLMSKPMLVTVPFVLLLLDDWPLRRLGTREAPFANLRARVLEKIPFLALSVASGVITLATQKGAMTSAETLPLLARAGNAVVAYGIYLRQLFLPVDLALIYPHPGAGPPLLEVGLAALVLAAVTIAAVALRPKHPYLLVGWLWFTGMLVPVIGLVQVGIQAHADRYTYLPHVGLIVAMVWGVAAIRPSSASLRRWKVAAGAAAVLALAVLAWQQTGHWSSSESIWRITLARTTDNSVAHAQLGTALLSAERISEAEEHFRRALAIQPDYATPRYNLGNVLAGRGKTEEAIEQYRLAIRARPDYAKAYNNLGAALASSGRQAEAVAWFRRALEIEPGYAQAHLGLASALNAGGDLEAAREHYLLAVRLEPANADALVGLGTLMARDKKLAEAVALYQKALAADPDHTEAHGHLGIALGMTGRLAAAVEHLKRAVALEPDSAMRHGNLAMALEMGGARAQALEHFRHALELAEARGDERLGSVLRSRLARLEGPSPDPN